MKFLDAQHPFFAPLWRRVAVVGFTLSWAVVEFATGTPFWGVLFAAVGVYSFWQFFVAFDPKPETREDQDG